MIAVLCLAVGVLGSRYHSRPPWVPGHGRTRETWRRATDRCRLWSCVAPSHKCDDRICDGRALRRCTFERDDRRAQHNTDEWRYPGEPKQRLGNLIRHDEGVKDLLAVARLAGADPGFNDLDQRGLIVPLRGLVAFSLAVWIGALVGQVLPAILASIPAFVLVLVVIGSSLGPWRVAESIVLPFGQGAIMPGALVIESVAILPDGTVVPEELVDGLPEGSFVDAARVLPATAASTWIARETIALAIVSLLASAGALATIKRRRPIL